MVHSRQTHEIKRIALFYHRMGVGVGILSGAARYVRERAHLRSNNYGPLTPQGVAQARAAGADGIICFIPDENALEMVSTLRVPIVNIANVRLGLDVPSVHADHHAIGRLAAAHLLRTGLRSMASPECTIHEGMATRNLSFRDAVLAAGATFHPLPENFAVYPGTARTDAAAIRILRKLPRPIGIFANCDPHAEVIIGLARLAGFSVPSDVAVVGVDNMLEVCAQCVPTITSVDLGADRIGYEATGLLDRMMSGDPPPKKPIVVSPAGIVARESSDTLAIDDPDLAEALRFLRANACHSLSVSDVLAACGLSRRTLERRITKYLGHSLHDEIMAVRMARADELLRTTDLTLGAIARLCGFTSQGYFTRVIRQRLGHTPAIIRSRSFRKA